MTGCPTHARKTRLLPPRKHEEPDRESDDEADDEADVDDDELEDDSGEDFDEADGEPLEESDDSEPDRPEMDAQGASSARADSRSAWERRVRRRARGAGGMGRRSTGPTPRPSSPPSAAVMGVAAASVEAESELATDISSWPGTADAAKMVGRHVSTIKLWRAQGRIRAQQDAAGCWRHHPDDLAESVDTPDATDAGSVLAAGMTAIVQQGASANERLLEMTEIAASGLQTAAGVLSKELERAYAKIAALEQKLSEAKDRLTATHDLDLKHERFMRRLDQKHELEVAGSKETSARLEALLTIVGPIAASMAARLIGRLGEAEALDAKAAGVTGGQNEAGDQSGQSEDRPNSPAAPAAAPSPLSLAKDDPLVPIETRITDAMSRLCLAIRSLDGPALQGFRSMMPPAVQVALDDILDGKTDSAVGHALATLIKAAQNLSDLQFKALRPIAPADIASILAELRELIRVKEDKPS